ncbi:hypothetical protein Mapa_012696 [Marchantia paleacea]|nr:hypothetical protein Mapa_012696 [Marchantia paleacea]
MRGQLLATASSANFLGSTSPNRRFMFPMIGNGFGPGGYFISSRFSPNTLTVTTARTTIARMVFHISGHDWHTKVSLRAANDAFSIDLDFELRSLFHSIRPEVSYFFS